MTNTFNRDQILRLTRETLDHTLRFFNTVNENLQHLVENVQCGETRTVNLDEATRICNEFHRDHETRMNQLTTIWQDFTHTVRNNIPTTIPNLFDPNEVIRLNREVIDHTMRFFTTTNEALIKGQVPQHDHILPRTVIETINRAITDFQKTQADFTRTFETTFHHVLKTVTPTVTPTPNREHQTVDTTTPLHTVRDEVFTLNRQIIENTVRFFMNLNEHVVAILENKDTRNVEKHADLINRVRNEFLNNHRSMVERFDTFIRRTAETFSTANTRTIDINNLTPLFDHQEVLLINQDAITTTVKYFTTVTENLLQVRNDNGETIIRATQDFQKHHRILTSRLETIWHDAAKRTIEAITPIRTHDHTTNETVCNNTRETVCGAPIPTPRNETPRPETLRRETPRHETPRNETPRSETPRPTRTTDTTKKRTTKR